MTLSLIHMPDDWSECIPIHILAAMNKYHDALTDELTWYAKNGERLGQRLNTYSILSQLRLYMPRKKGQNVSTINTRKYDSSGSSGGNEWKWLNVALQDEDIDELERSDATLEFLAGCIVVLADDGYGVTIKPVDRGESRCCTIYRPDFPSTGVTCGISSFASTVRDALLVSLYKFDEKLGGDFANWEQFTSSDKQKSRFR